MIIMSIDGVAGRSMVDEGALGEISGRVTADEVVGGVTFSVNAGWK